MLKKIDYLRVSVTNKCNLNCIFCHPVSDKCAMEYQDILELNEILRIIRLFTKCGIKTVRLTGNEPLLKKDILHLVRQISSTEEIENVTAIKGYGPAVYFKIKNSLGKVGFISGRSMMFCNKCDRLCLSCDGKIKPCLYAAKQYDLKKMIRNGMNDEEIMSIIKEIIHEKNITISRTRP